MGHAGVYTPTPGAAWSPDWSSFRLVLFCAECFCEGGEDARIPLLREVFEAFPNTPVNIDIKVNNDTLIRKVVIQQIQPARSIQL